MHRCIKCGSEFEGNFCPECGEKWQEDKLCPNCGASLGGSAKFCTECGYSFITSNEAAATSVAENVKTVQINYAKSNTLEKVYAILKAVPAVLCLLFAALLFAFYSAPVAVMPIQEIFGEKIGGMSYGNVYSMYSGILGEFPEFKSAVIALLTLASIALAYSIFCVTAKFIPAIKYKKVKNLSLADIFVLLFNVFYLIFFIIGCAMCGIVAYLDDGMELLGAGACPILLIVFSVLFTGFEIGALLGRKFISKKYPEFAENECKNYNEQCENYKEKLLAAIANLPAPVEPVKPEKIERPLKIEDRLLGFKRAVIYASFMSIPYFGIGSSPMLASLSYFGADITFLLLLLGIAFCLIIVISILPILLFVFTCKSVKYISLSNLCSKKFNLYPLIFILLMLSTIGFCIYWAISRFYDALFYLSVLVFAPYVIVLIICMIVGNKKTNRIRVKYYGTEKPKKDAPLTEYGDKFTEEKEKYLTYFNNQRLLKVFKRDYRNFKLENFVYSKNRNYTKIPKIIKWANIHRFFIAAVAVVLAIIITICCTLNNTVFTVNTVSKINYGDTREQVEKILGEPSKLSTDTEVYYLSNKDYENLILNNNISEIEKFENGTEIKMISISYDTNNCVYAVRFDNNHKLSLLADKEVNEINVSHNGDSLKTISENIITAQIYYKDGSYSLYSIDYLVKAKITGSGSYDLEWSDSWGSYSTTYKVK